MSTPMTVMLPPDLGQVAFGLQGSGSLGADQVAVDQALHEAGVEPDWATSASIGAINASIIAGNKPTKRVSGLTAFWQSVDHGPFQQVIGTRRCGGVGIEVAHFDGRHGDAPAPCQLPLPTREKFCSVRFNTSEIGWIEIAPTS